MKRLSAILLLALLLYNAFGYYALFAYEHKQAALRNVLNLPDSAFEVVKIKAAIYASVENTDYEYVNEDLTIEDKTYHIVKKRIQNDTLFVYYLRNFKQEELRKNLNEILESQLVNDNTEEGNDPIKQLLKTFLKDYIPNNIFALKLKKTPSNTEGVVLNASIPFFKTGNYLSIHAPPPRIG